MVKISVFRGGYYEKSDSGGVSIKGGVPIFSGFRGEDLKRGEEKNSGGGG